MPGAREQHRGCGTEAFLEAAHCHLLQVGIVEPELAPVGDDDLLIGVAIVPAKPVGPGDRKRASSTLRDAPFTIAHHLHERRRQRLDAGQVTRDAGNGVVGRVRRAGERQPRGSRAESRATLC